jgi:ubiquinol-cytochrome c reductase iron-sulfur subunit
MNSDVDQAAGPDDKGRRHFLVAATTAMGIAGAAATAVPFLASWKPSAKAKALGAPVEADISKLEPGALMKIEWRGQAIFIVHRTPEMLAKLPELDSQLRDPGSNESEQPDYTKNGVRSLKPEILVFIGVCTHLGCAPLPKFQAGDAELGADWKGGFLCPCHGSRFDLAGRIMKGHPALWNLRVPPYRFATDTQLVIGEDSGVA